MFGYEDGIAVHIEERVARRALEDAGMTLGVRTSGFGCKYTIFDASGEAVVTSDDIHEIVDWTERAA